MPKLTPCQLRDAPPHPLTGSSEVLPIAQHPQAKHRSAMPGEVAAAVAAGAAGAGGEGGQQGQQRQQGGFGQLLGMVVRMGVMWYFMNMMKVRAPKIWASAHAEKKA